MTEFRGLCRKYRMEVNSSDSAFYCSLWRSRVFSSLYSRTCELCVHYRSESGYERRLLSDKAPDYWLRRVAKLKQDEGLALSQLIERVRNS